MTQTVTSLRLILGDQLSRTLASLTDCDKQADLIVLAEVMEEARYVPHHKKKLVFVFSAMRHFAAELEAAGYRVRYFRLDDPEAPETLTEVVSGLVEHYRPERLVLTEPGEYRVRNMMEDWRETLDCSVLMRPDTRFFASRADFEDWAGPDPKSLRMEYFYREMRKRTGYLMEDGKPVGGQFNFDHDNRKSIPASISPPKRPHTEPDAITRAVIDMVGEKFADNFGALEPFDYPVTRRSALYYLSWFVEHALVDFGTYQDGMRSGDPLLFHAHLSALINIGLLEPREVCEAALAAFDDDKVPLNAVEGFVRQIIGWREFVRGVYWLKMPGYGEANVLNATRPLPDFFWNADTDLNCLANAVGDTWEHAYAHHIQRLMIIGNFALLAGLDPKAVQHWFLLVYFDAYEWVEMPNVVGMALFADGGFFASKPYAAAAAYINRMSDYCGSCRFDPKKRHGDNACPFNALYWDFLARNRERFSANRRMSVILANLDRFDDTERKAIGAAAKAFLEQL